MSYLWQSLDKHLYDKGHIYQTLMFLSDKDVYVTVLLL